MKMENLEFPLMRCYDRHDDLLLWWQFLFKEQVSHYQKYPRLWRRIFTILSILPENYKL
jgi:hypothetical protein